MDISVMMIRTDRKILECIILIQIIVISNLILSTQLIVKRVITNKMSEYLNLHCQRPL